MHVRATSQSVSHLGERGVRWLLRNRLFVLIAITYAYFYQGGDPNQTSRLLLTRAIVERGAVDISPEHHLTLDKGQFGRKYYSDKAPGVSLLCAVPWAIMRKVDRVAGFSSDSRTMLHVRQHVLTFLFSGLAGAIAAYFTWRCLLLLGFGAGVSHVLTIGYALGTLAFPFSTVLFGHELTAALLVAAFFLLLRARKRETDLTSKETAGFGLLLGVAVVCEYPSGLLGAIMGLCLLSWDWSRARLIRVVRDVALGAFLPLAIHSLFLYRAFGSPIALPYKYVIEPIFVAHTSTGVLGIGIPTWEGTYGSLVSRYRGIFFYCPFLALTFAGIAAWIRKNEGRREVLVVSALIAAHLLFCTSYYAWDGGGSTGPRHLVPVLPFFVLPIGYFMEKSLTFKWLTAVAVVLSVVVMYLCTATVVQMQEASLYDSNPIYDLVIPAVVRGEVATNPQDSFYPRFQGDASYNLGTLFGLAPITSLLVLPAIWALAYGVSLRRRHFCNCAEASSGSREAEA